MTVDEAATEALETDNLALQTMSGGKYVQVTACANSANPVIQQAHKQDADSPVFQANAVFLEKVTTWQRKLGMVDAVLSTWTDVQRKWQALESIFVGSADIRVQLPDDSKRFDSVNADFQVSPSVLPDCFGSASPGPMYLLCVWTPAGPHERRARAEQRGGGLQPGGPPGAHGRAVDAA